MGTSVLKSKELVTYLLLYLLLTGFVFTSSKKLPLFLFIVIYLFLFYLLHYIMKVTLLVTDTNLPRGTLEIK